MNKFIITGDVPPNETYKLLKQWDVKDNLAIALIEHYGGHLYDIEQALHRLHDKKKLFRTFRSESFDNVNKCLDHKFEYQREYDKMVEMLQELAEKGFCVVEEPYYNIAKVISEANVGGLIVPITTVYGLPEEEFGTDWGYALIPTQQSMRLAMIKVLQDRHLID